MLLTPNAFDPAAAADMIAELKRLVGADVVLAADEADMTRHLRDLLVVAAETVRPIGVAYPRSTAQVASILRFADQHRLPIVPQGGLSGLAGGAIPIGPALLLSLERMRRIEEVDRASMTITVEAGVVVETVQKAAEAAGVFFAMDWGGRGSAQIGGAVSTNAGGNRVLRFGMMRDVVLGLEVVLADGTVLTMLNKMMKNNSGYDLKHMFIGTEGTLGVVTRAVLKLSPKPTSTVTALCGLEGFGPVLQLLDDARQALGPSLASFEVMWPEFYHLGTTALDRVPPLALGYGAYVLIEVLGTNQDRDTEDLGTLLEATMERGVVQDAVLAKSGRETAAIWAVRDCTAEMHRTFGEMAAFDISIPASQTGPFVEQLQSTLRALWPDVAMALFGHVADGNLHLAVKLDGSAGTEQEIEEVVYPLISGWGGAVSGEHGIGIHKVPYLRHARSPEEMLLMRRLKAMLDPNGIMNPGKVFLP